jgi:hypothetical protein
MTIAILFARAESIYKSLPDCEVYDQARDALTWPGGTPCVAHPPCRLWGKLAHCSSAPLQEKGLALWAITQVRQWGGVVEHPASSRLWQAAGCPRPSQGRDAWGGWTFGLYQQWFGHKAQKATWLYIVGCMPTEMPRLPFVLGEATHVVTQSRRRHGAALPECTVAEREQTPPRLAQWLVAIAQQAARTPAGVAPALPRVQAPAP